MLDVKPPLFRRFAAEKVLAALTDTPVVMLNGPRQCGKTTLVQSLIGTDHTYITLDDDTALAAARHDPAGFIRNLDKIVIDEIQRAPELLRAIKKSVDEDRRPGRFLLSGSANVLTLPQVSESLAGRMAIIDLLPLSQAEILGVKPTFLDRAYTGRLPKLPKL
ncbi:MAG: AAA family ATPase, partial [Spongiibacteraceae bacterium]